MNRKPEKKLFALNGIIETTGKMSNICRFALRLYQYYFPNFDNGTVVILKSLWFLQVVKLLAVNGRHISKLLSSSSEKNVRV